MKRVSYRWLSVLLAVAAMAGGNALAETKDPKLVAKEREAIRQQLKQVRQNIEQTTSRQTSTSKELVAVEKSIAESNAQLQRLQKENERLKAEILAISEDQDETEKNIERQKSRLGKVLRSQHRRSQYNPMHAWLGGQSRQAISRDAFWYEHISAAEIAVGETLKDELDELEALLGAKEERQDQVQSNENAQQRKKVVLLEQQDTRKQLLGELSKRLESQKQEANRLERDEKRMTSLIEELAEAIRLAKKRAEAERKTAESKPRPAQQRRSEMTYSTVPDNGDFAKLKGRLELPSGGEITGRFGQTRSSDGSGPAWRGIFIKVGQGAPVKAVSSGKVVFSEWLRGFGQLIILDHGDQYMSIYGNNQRLLKAVGDTVKQGDSIASVGDSSGNLETGLYFELRHQGQPIDPLKWAVTR